MSAVQYLNERLVFHSNSSYIAAVRDHNQPIVVFQFRWSFLLGSNEEVTHR